MELVSILRCPLCSGGLGKSDSGFTCDPCRKTYPVHFGIPDFRLFPPNVVGYKSEQEDLKLSAYLMDFYEKVSFEELVSLYIRRSSNHLVKTLQDRYIEYRLNNLARAMRLVNWLRDHEYSASNNGNVSIGLDIGCGSGSGLATLLETGTIAVGMDITIANLVLAKSFLKNNYPDRDYLLVAGVAEHLPFPSEYFSNVLAVDVFEHVSNQKQFIQEACRVMRPGSCFYFDTPSRFRWIEPHTVLPVVGYLPRFLQPHYVRLARNRNYKIYLPSLWELKSCLNDSPFTHNWNIIYTQKNTSGEAKTWRGQLVRTVPGILYMYNSLLKLVSSYKVIARKSA